MPFNSETAREAGRKGGLQRIQNENEKKRKLDQHLLWLAEGGAEKMHEKMVALSNGAEITKPEKEFIQHYKDLMEYHQPKLSRAEITGKDGEDLPMPILTINLDNVSNDNRNPKGSGDEGEN